MHSGPPKIAEAIVAVLVPPACHEEVLGDLHERFKSPLQYTADALLTVPLVIISRMRRTADPQVLLIQACALYMSFLGAAWLRDGAVLSEQWALVRLAIPAAMATLGLILEDTYVSPGPRSPLNLARGPVLGLVMALASQRLMWIGDSNLALPGWITLYGCTTGLLLSSAVRILFPPVTRQLLGANAPSLWLKQPGGSNGSLPEIIRVLKSISAVVALPGIVMLLLVLVIAYQILKRA